MGADLQKDGAFRVANRSNGPDEANQLAKIADPVARAERGALHEGSLNCRTERNCGGTDIELTDLSGEIGEHGVHVSPVRRVRKRYAPREDIAGLQLSKPQA